MTPRARYVAQLLVSLLLLAVLMLRVDVGAMGAAFAHARLGMLLAALALTVANQVLLPLKWNLLLRVRGVRVGWWDAIGLYLASTYLGIFLPSTVGADAIRTYTVTRKGHPLAPVLSSVIVERLLMLIAMVWFGALGALLLLSREGGEGDVRRLVVLAAGIGAVALLGFGVSLTDGFARVASAVLRGAAGAEQGRVRAQLWKLYASYRAYRDHPRMLLLFFGLTCLSVLVQVARAYVTALALGAVVSPVYCLAFMPLLAMLIRLPISFDGFGINEGGFVYFLARVGVPEAVGLSVGVANHALYLLVVVAGGLYWTVRGSGEMPPAAAAAAADGDAGAPAARA